MLSEHQLAGQALPQRMLLDEPARFRDQRVVMSERELSVDQQLLRDQAPLMQLLPRRLRVCGCDVRQRLTTPQPERRTQLTGRLLVVATSRGNARRLDVAVEDVGVQFIAGQSQPVSAGCGDDDTASSGKDRVRCCPPLTATNRSEPRAPVRKRCVPR